MDENTDKRILRKGLLLSGLLLVGLALIVAIVFGITKNTIIKDKYEAGQASRAETSPGTISRDR